MINYVYFDDFKVTHTKTNVIQSNEYYPFGMQAAESWTRENNSNNFLYNEGSEVNTTSGFYDLPFRNYDATLGRFFQVDPLAHTDHVISPFAYAGNNPITGNDPSGLMVDYSHSYENPDYRGMMEQAALDAQQGAANSEALWAQEPHAGGNANFSAVTGTPMTIAEFLVTMETSTAEGGMWKDGRVTFQDTKFEAISATGYYVAETTSSTDYSSVSTSSEIGYTTATPIIHYKLVKKTQQKGPGNQHEYDTWQNLTPEEKELVKWYPDAAYVIYENQKIAFQVTNSKFSGVSQHNTAADAFRHAFFNAMNARDVGSEIALKFAFAHEADPNNPLNEKLMDILNNFKGINIGNNSALSDSALATQVYNATVHGQLYMLNSSSNLVKTHWP